MANIDRNIRSNQKPYAFWYVTMFNFYFLRQGVSYRDIQYNNKTISKVLLFI